MVEPMGAFNRYVRATAHWDEALLIDVDVVRGDGRSFAVRRSIYFFSVMTQAPAPTRAAMSAARRRNRRGSGDRLIHEQLPPRRTR